MITYDIARVMAIAVGVVLVIAAVVLVLIYGNRR